MRTLALARMGLRFVKQEISRHCLSLIGREAYFPSFVIDAQLTLRCNLRCLQCPMWQTEENEELSTADWKSIIADIRSTIGPFFIKFYGGEPLFRGDTLDLIDFCSKLDIGTLLTTNGTLIDRDVAQALISNKVFVQISVDGAFPQTHDRLRGVQGSHGRVLAAIEYLAGKTPLQINTTIMQDNLDEILKLADFASSKKIRISFCGLITIGFGKERKICLQREHPLFPKDLRKLDFVIDELCKRRKNSSFIVNSVHSLQRHKLYYHHVLRSKKDVCEALGNYLVIKKTGNVQPCPFSEPMGNLKKQTFRQIWKSEELKRAVKESRHCGIAECLITRGCYKQDWLDIFRKVKHFFFFDRSAKSSGIL